VWYQKRNNRIDWLLHNILNEIVALAEEERLLIVLEDLGNIKAGVNRREARINKVNDKLQPHRRMPRYMLGRLNRWMARRIQNFIDYKAEWLDIPKEYVNPRGTSSTCPRCGGELNPSSNWHVAYCISCGLTGNRHYLSCVNIASRIEDEALRFGVDWRTMEPHFEVVSPSVGTS
jgi:putative transposase